MKRMMGVVCALFVAVGCNTDDGILPVPADEMNGSGPTEPDDPRVGQSGSRLKKRVMESDDGSRQFLGWHDSEFQKNCVFRKGPDGTQRCMPSDLVHEIYGLSGLDAVVYSDSDCKNAMYVSQMPKRGDCGKLVQYVFQAPEGTDVCTGEYYYTYEVGEEIELSADRQFYAKRDIGCHVFTMVADVRAFSAKELTADRFVAGTESLEE